MHLKIFVLFLFNTVLGETESNGRYYKISGSDVCGRYKYFREIIEKQNFEEAEMCSAVTNDHPWETAKISEDGQCFKKHESGCDEERFVSAGSNMYRKKDNTYENCLCDGNATKNNTLVFPVYDRTRYSINFPNFFQNTMDMLRFSEVDTHGHYRLVVPNYLFKQFLYFFFYPILGVKVTGWLPVAILRWLRGYLFNVYYNPYHT